MTDSEKPKAFTRAEIIMWPAMGPMNLDMQRMLVTVAERESFLAQGMADHCALADALGWGGEFNRSTLPPPWRAVTAIIKERDDAQAKVRVLEVQLKFALKHGRDLLHVVDQAALDRPAYREVIREAREVLEES